MKAEVGLIPLIVMNTSLDVASHNTTFKDVLIKDNNVLINIKLLIKNKFRMEEMKIIYFNLVKIKDDFIFLKIEMIEVMTH